MSRITSKGGKKVLLFNKYNGVIETVDLFMIDKEEEKCTPNTAHFEITTYLVVGKTIWRIAELEVYLSYNCVVLLALTDLTHSLASYERLDLFKSHALH
ncbi:hypothetical protein TNIN_337471 [Trichonephila inaurata madagascariensis]|uniref:Uncharacterized protein n=1 Tax=Trichonephila inaurata madagascariensis TaxID=2747483 RepID=A0A8X6XRU3_9ARAC|nr:hypothetical protein TNIN_337471 [Trichonephila inaurata madagascariensis]